MLSSSSRGDLGTSNVGLLLTPKSYAAFLDVPTKRSRGADATPCLMSWLYATPCLMSWLYATPCLMLWLYATPCLMSWLYATPGSLVCSGAAITSSIRYSRAAATATDGSISPSRASASRTATTTDSPSVL